MWRNQSTLRRQATGEGMSRFARPASASTLGASVPASPRSRSTAAPRYFESATPRSRGGLWRERPA
jgi:hypothetical protein